MRFLSLLTICLALHSMDSRRAKRRRFDMDYAMKTMTEVMTADSSGNTTAGLNCD